jgi:hypothetical protein
MGHTAVYPDEDEEAFAYTRYDFSVDWLVSFISASPTWHSSTAP